MAVAFLPILPELRKYCTFSTTLEQSELTMLMKRPQESATGSGLLAPFNKIVWLLVLTSVVTVGPIIYVFATFRFVRSASFTNETRVYYENALVLNIVNIFVRAKLWNDPDSENYTFFSCVWFVYGSLLKQGTNIIATTGMGLSCCPH